MRIVSITSNKLRSTFRHVKFTSSHAHLMRMKKPFLYTNLDQFAPHIIDVVCDVNLEHLLINIMEYHGNQFIHSFIYLVYI